MVLCKMAMALSCLPSLSYSWREQAHTVDAHSSPSAERRSTLRSSERRTATGTVDPLALLTTLLLAFNPAHIGVRARLPSTFMRRLRDLDQWERLRHRVGSCVAMKLKGRAPPQAEYFSISADGSDIWQAMDIFQTLRDGGVGVMPTDTGYSFVTSVSSREGVPRILNFIDSDDQRKPLSLYCADLSTLSHYTAEVDRPTFKMLKGCLPGPYTFILPASGNLPKTYIKSGKRKYKRQTVGVRIPDDPVVQTVLEQLDEPLLGLSVPMEDGGAQLTCNLDMSSSWCREVDFVLDAADRPVDVSTIYDLTGDEPELIRQGQGPPIDL